MKLFKDWGKMERLTTLEKLVLKYPKAPWIWYQLSGNDCITLQFIKDHPEFPWDIEGLAWNRNVTEEFIIHHNIHWEVDTLFVADNPNLSLEFILKLSVKNDSHWISQNKFLTLSFIDAHPEVAWEWNEVSSWITLYDFDPEREWDWTAMSDNPHVTEEFVERFISKPWRWLRLSYHPNITMEFVKRHHEKPWNISYLSSNPNLTIEFIMDNRSWNWNWGCVSSNPGIQQSDIEKYPELPWDINNLLYNESIIPPPGSPFDFYNPNITLEIIEQNYDTIYWNDLSQNTFERNTERYESVRSRKRIKIVQKWWRHTRRQRLFKELDEVIQISDLARYVSE